MLYDVISRDHGASPWCQKTTDRYGNPCGRPTTRYLMARRGPTWPWSPFSYCDRTRDANHRADLLRQLRAQGFEIIDGFRLPPLPEYPDNLPALLALQQIAARRHITGRAGIARVHRASVDPHAADA